MGIIQKEEENRFILANVTLQLKNVSYSKANISIDDLIFINCLELKDACGNIIKPDIEPTRQIPPKTTLLQSFPNPARNACYIPFELSEDCSNVELRIYDISGKLVRSIYLGQIRAGSYISKDKALFWDLSNDSGKKVTTGIYIYQLTTEKFTIKKLDVIK